MDAQTVKYYNETAKETCLRYRAAETDNIKQWATRNLGHGAGIQASILDVGCGSGRDCQALLELGSEVTGVDASASMLSEAREYYPELSKRILLDALPKLTSLGNATFNAVLAQ